MVAGAFPLAKLGVLLLRQISKPIAGYIKEGAKRSNAFRNYVCVPTAQFYNWVEQRWKLWAMGFGTPQTVQRLTEERAIELGGDILGEAFIFVTAAGGLTFEYYRSSVKSKAKEEAQEQRLINLENRVIEMDFSNEQLRAQLRQFEREMHASPLRALKEKFAPATTASKPDQKSASGASSGSTSASTTTPPSTSSGGSPSTNQESTKPSNGTPSSQFGSVNAGVESSGAVSEHRVVKSSISGKGDDQYRNKMVRRAIKILMDAYEETVDED